jgi:hypothetical protein
MFGSRLAKSLAFYTAMLIFCAGIFNLNGFFFWVALAGLVFLLIALFVDSSMFVASYCVEEDGFGPLLFYWFVYIVIGICLLLLAGYGVWHATLFCI